MLLGECRAFIYLKVCLKLLGEVRLLSEEFLCSRYYRPLPTFGHCASVPLSSSGTQELYYCTRLQTKCHNDHTFHELFPPMSLLQAHTILIMAKLSKNCRMFALIECRLQSTSLIFWLVTCDWAQRDGGYVFPECVGGASCLELQTKNLLLLTYSWQHRFHI